MLQHVNRSVIPAREAEAALFPQALEFNPPVHENWNIVHIAMQIPEAHQIYICGYNCMRGVVLTAAEMGAQDRFSSVILYEEDVIDGTLWEATRDGIADVLHKLPKLPPCVIVFPVCTHHFAGVDLDSIYASLEAEFPTVDFVRAFMDPIMQKHGLPPDQRLRKVMYDPLPKCMPTEKTVTFTEAGSYSVNYSGFTVTGNYRIKQRFRLNKLYVYIDSRLWSKAVINHILKNLALVTTGYNPYFDKVFSTFFVNITKTCRVYKE